jgi:hypothetical protein
MLVCVLLVLLLLLPPPAPLLLSSPRPRLLVVTWPAVSAVAVWHCSVTTKPRSVGFMKGSVGFVGVYEVFRGVPCRDRGEAAGLLLASSGSVNQC